MVANRQALPRRWKAAICKLGSIRVATKYPQHHPFLLCQDGHAVEIVKLHGNIELAPITGMAERIIDITATGTYAAREQPGGS